MVVPGLPPEPLPDPDPEGPLLPDEPLPVGELPPLPPVADAPEPLPFVPDAPLPGASVVEPPEGSLLLPVEVVEGGSEPALAGRFAEFGLLPQLI